MSIDNEIRSMMDDGVMSGVAEGMAALVRAKNKNTQQTLDEVLALRDDAILLLSMIDKAFSATGEGRVS